MSERLSITFRVGNYSVSHKTKIRAFNKDFATMSTLAAEEWEISVKKELPRLICEVMRKWAQNG